ncbi:MAG: hypothetical protein RLZZ522_1712 [Verrucomicrobiota bacterium]|jgi:hypothetical protein
MSPLRRLALALVLLTTSLLWITRTGTPPPDRSTPPPAAAFTPNDSTPRPARARKTTATPVSDRINSEETWDIDLAGQPLAITLALDEAVLRDADGKESIARHSENLARPPR